MALSQSSFRRILLTRLLTISVPVLLMGVYVTYRKARTAFLETARQNLTESAIRKGENIDRSIEALQSNLATASDSVILKHGSQAQQQVFLDRLAVKLPTEIQCVQLTNFQSSQIVASTCERQPINQLDKSLWTKRQNTLHTEIDEIDVKFLSPKPGAKPKKSKKAQLELLLSSPLYDDRGNLRYILSFKSALLEKESVTRNTEPGSLTGYTVVIDRQGTILAHPYSHRIGHNIKEEADAKRLTDLVKNAIAGQSNFLHLFAFEKMA